MLLCAHYIIPITSEPLSDGAILVSDGVIKDMGKAELMKLRYPDEEVKEFGNAALLPGLIDLHTHLEMAALRGIVHDKPYIEWMEAMHQKSTQLDVLDWYDSAYLGALEALSSGITCIADITATGASSTAVSKLGMRGMIYRDVVAMDKRRVDFAVRQAENDIIQWSQNVDPELVTLGLAPGALYLCHPAMFTAVTQLATARNLPVAVRLAGSREEYNFVKYGSSAYSVHGMDDRRGYVEVPPWLPTSTTPTCYAMNWGAFEAPNVLAVHCVHVDEDDIRILKDHDVAVAVCPNFNSQLGEGVAPVGELRRAGLTVGLGTDSPAAIEFMDILREMRLCMLIQRAVDSQNFMETVEVLNMATIEAARALKIDDKVGSLELGKRADIIAVDLREAKRAPQDDPVAAVVNGCSGRNVMMTMVDGVCLYENGVWAAGEEAVAQNAQRVEQIKQKLRG